MAAAVAAATASSAATANSTANTTTTTTATTGGGATGAAAAAGGGGGGSGLEATLDKKLLTVSNTMDSIQGLSSWILDNKKHYTSIVRHWMKCMRKSSITHRLNLFYVANDVIQNCKRKNAIIFRDAFSEVLVEAGALVRDPSIRKSVDRIFTIWEQRSVYPEELIVDLRAALVGRKTTDFTKVKPVGRKTTDFTKVKPVSNKTRVVVKSKILAEFRPPALIDQLGSYKQAEDEREFKEKQLGSLRVDVCSTETLKRLKDRAGGKRFSKDFEESSSKLEDFCAELEREVKKTPPLIEALENAEIFYEAQYKEVKIVANAYKTFANRVNNLKKKLDQLKTTLPDPDESPIPSPCMDAPSPTGSESPVRPAEEVAPEPAKKAEESPLPPTPEASGDNCDVEDMELSDDEAAGATSIIAVEREEKKEESSPSVTAASPSPSPQPEKLSTQAESTQAKSSSITPPLGLPNLANIDLGKISSILSSLTTAMKNTVSPVLVQTPALAATSAASPGLQLATGQKTPVQKPPPLPPNPLASILSKMELTPQSILSALSKTQGPSAPALQGLSSLLQSVTGNTSVPSGGASQSISTPAAANVTSPLDKNPPINSSAQPTIQGLVGCSPNSPASEVSSASSVTSAPVNHSPALPNASLKAPASTKVLEGSLRNAASSPRGSAAREKGPAQAVKAGAEVVKTEADVRPPSPSSLELKIHNFLKVNPGFKALDLNIPLLSNLGSSDSKSLLQPSEGTRNPSSNILDNQDGTPVRDERGGTPTQDEIMDKPATTGAIDPMSLLSKLISPPSSSTSSTISPPLSMTQNMDSGYSEISSAVPSYQSDASYNRGRTSFPSSYKPSEMWEESSPHSDSPQEQFYAGESCTDFDFAGPSLSLVSNLLKQPAKSILKSNKPGDPMQSPNEYQSISASYSRLNSAFSKPMKSILKKQEGYSSRSNSSKGYREDDQGIDRENLPSPGQNNQFFRSESNNIILQPTFSDLSRAGPLQKAFSDSLCSTPSRPSVSSQSAASGPFSRAPAPTIDKAVTLGSPVSATSTIEFKNMLKNASRRPADDKPAESPISPAPGSGGPGEKGNAPMFGQSGMAESVDGEQHCIETRISTSNLPENMEEKGAPIETLGSSTPSVGRVMIGEPIQTLDSSRGSGKGSMSHGRGGSRGSWFEPSESISDFDDDSSSIEVSEMTLGVSPSFRSQFEERRLQFSDTPSGYRPNSYGNPFERQTGHPPSSRHDHHGPPPVPSRDHIGHPPGPPPDHVLPQDHIGPPPVPMRDIGPRDHMSLPPGPPPDRLVQPQEHMSGSSGSLRDHSSFPGSSQDHSGPPPGSSHEKIGPPRDHVGPPSVTSVDHIAPPSGPPPDRFGPPRDHLGPPPGPPVPPPGPPPLDHMGPPPGPPPRDHMGPPPIPPLGPPPRDHLGPPPPGPPPGPPPRDQLVHPPQDLLGPLPGSPRDLLGSLAGPPRELLGLLPCPPRDFLGLAGRPPVQRSPRDYYGPPFGSQQDYGGSGRFFHRDFRGSFRPRETFQSGKRPALSFGSPPFATAPKRPYMPPRY